MAQNEKEVRKELVKIDLKKIKTDPDQPRKDFDEEKIEKLAASMDADGLEFPILVKPDKNYEKKGEVILVAGERRFRAATLLKWDEIDAIIIFGVTDTFEISLIENVNRESLNPIEEAKGFAKLSKDKNLTHAQVGIRMGKSNAFIGSRIKLLKLPTVVQDLIKKEMLSTTIALCLLNHELSADEIVSYANMSVREGLTEKMLNQKIRKIIGDRKAKEIGVKVFSEDEKLEYSAKKNMVYFLDRVCSYIIHISQKDKIGQKVFLTENFNRGDRGVIKLALQKIIKRAQALIKVLEEME